MCGASQPKENIMSDKDILLEKKTTFGIERFYPVNMTAKLFAQIAKSVTLLPETIEILKVLGYTVKIKGKEEEEI